MIERPNDSSKKINPLMGYLGGMTQAGLDTIHGNW
jgi:hypothetical protein